MDILYKSKSESQKFYGVTVGIVIDNIDPEELSRLKVSLAFMPQSPIDVWANVMTPMSGDEYGIHFLPDVDDQVLVAFENGDMTRPFILGSLWSNSNKPPEKNADGKNNIKMIKTRSGHVIKLDDSSGAEKIEIIDKTESNMLIIDSVNNKITIKSAGDIVLESENKITMKGNSIEIESQSMIAKASGVVTIEGHPIKLN